MNVTSEQKKNHDNRTQTAYTIVMLCVWVGIVVLCLLNKDYFTVDGILQIAPENYFAAFAVFLGLFAIKSLSLFLYSGILYAAIGLLFPFHVAFLAATCGSIVMFTIPYLIGRKIGTPAFNALSEKYPKVALIKTLRGKNDFVCAVVVRLISIVSYDVAGICLGALDLKYIPFLLGSLCGYLPFMLVMTFIGDSVQTPGSPQFIISASFAVLQKVVSLVICWMLWRKYQNLVRQSKEAEESNTP